MGKKGKHEYDEKVLNLHIAQGSYGGGACLNRHVSKYEATSCSHRWQGFKKAKEDSQLYNYPAYESLVRTQSRKTYIGFKRGALKIPISFLRPNPGDWDLGKELIKGVKNFQTSSTIPYFYNVHHIIPNSVLNNTILEAAENKKSYILYKLLRQGLLKSKYNLNYKDNTVILPMAKSIGKALRLPRHISGIESPPGSTPSFMDHAIYSDKIKKRVKEIIDDYIKLLDKADKDHPEPPADLSKAKLENLSREIYRRLKRWGKEVGGQALDEFEEWVCV